MSTSSITGGVGGVPALTPRSSRVKAKKDLGTGLPEAPATIAKVTGVVRLGSKTNGIILGDRGSNEELDVMVQPRRRGTQQPTHVPTKLSRKLLDKPKKDKPKRSGDMTLMTDAFKDAPGLESIESVAKPQKKEESFWSRHAATILTIVAVAILGGGVAYSCFKLDVLSSPDVLIAYGLGTFILGGAVCYILKPEQAVDGQEPKSRMRKGAYFLIALLAIGAVGAAVGGTIYGLNRELFWDIVHKVQPVVEHAVITDAWKVIATGVAMGAIPVALLAGYLAQGRKEDKKEVEKTDAEITKVVVEDESPLPDSSAAEPEHLNPDPRRVNLWEE
jgi:hypothetical protein